MPVVQKSTHNIKIWGGFLGGIFITLLNLPKTMFDYCLALPGA